jgi:hypothetical protein
MIDFRIYIQSVASAVAAIPLGCSRPADTMDGQGLAAPARKLFSVRQHCRGGEIRFNIQGAPRSRRQ